MTRRCSILLALVLASGPAAAAVPYPGTSIVPLCEVSCPMGDIPFTVWVRDYAYVPVANSMVVLDFSSCPGVTVCGGVTPDPYIYDPPSRTARALTNSSGYVTFPLRAGGVCPESRVRVYADGVLLGSPRFASPDQNGDGFVTYPEDTALLAAKVGTADLTGDLDCDGDVDKDDVNVQNYHLSQSCIGWIDPVRPRSWGGLKLHYR